MESLILSPIRQKSITLSSFAENQQPFPMIQTLYLYAGSAVVTLVNAQSVSCFRLGLGLQLEWLELDQL